MRGLLGILMFSLIGIWQSGDVVYTFYPNHTGVVWDSVEGDTITKWYERGNKLILENCMYWNDTSILRFYPLGKDKFSLDGYIFKRKKK